MKNKLAIGSIIVLVVSFVLIIFGRAIIAELGLMAVFNLSWPNPDALNLFLSRLWIAGYALTGLGIAVFLGLGIKSRFKVDNEQVKHQLKSKRLIILLSCCLVGLAFSGIFTAPLVNAESVATTGYYLSTPLPIADWYIGKYSSGSYFAINGSSWANLMTYPAPAPWASYSSNYTKVEELVLGNLTAGTVYLKETPFNYNVSVPNNVQVIENLNGLTRTFVNSSTQGSPYTVSVDTVNPAYYLVQDSQDRFINSFTSTNATSVIQQSWDACTKGGEIIVRPGDYNIDTIQVTNKNSVKLVGESGQYTWQTGTGTGVRFKPTANTNGAMIKLMGNSPIGQNMLYGVRIEGINFYDPTHSYNIYAIETNNTEELYIQYCNFKYLKGGALLAHNALYTGGLEDSTIHSCGSTTSPSINFNNTVPITSLPATYPMGFTFNKLQMEFCFGRYMYFNNTKQCTITDGYFESNSSATDLVYCDTGTEGFNINNNHGWFDGSGTIFTVYFKNSVSFNEIFGSPLCGVNCTGTFNRVEGNSIEYTQYQGIELNKADSSIVTGNLLNMTGTFGVLALNSNNVTVTANNIYYLQSSQYGIRVTNTNYSTFGPNNIQPTGARTYSKISGMGNTYYSGQITSQLLDYYPESNKDGMLNITSTFPNASAVNSAWGQVFAGTSGFSVSSIQFYLAKSGSPSGNMAVALYDASGTYGTNMLPLTSAIGTSDNVTIESLTGSFALVTFTFSTPVALANHKYCAVVEPLSGTVDASNLIMVGRDNSSPYHEGNPCYYYSGAWQALNSSDFPFYVNGIANGYS